MSLDNEASKVIQGRFHLIKKLGAGSFGEIFEAKDLKTGKLYACKAESIRSKHPQLRLEYNIYRALQQSKYFVRVWGFVTHYNHQIMIMDKLGESLEQLFTSCGRKFSIHCVCQIAIQILSRIEELHKHDYLHRDIKPDNFLIGHVPSGDLTKPEASKIYMIDLGLGKVWKENGRHIAEKTGKRLIGTPRYASINTHFGTEQSRRDDLESLGYMLMYFAHGHLPWQGLRGDTKEEKYHKIGKKKDQTPLKELCAGYPEQFKKYLKHTKSLGFQEDPPYDQYRAWFKEVLINHPATGPFKFDWQNKYYQKKYATSNAAPSARKNVVNTTNNNTTSKRERTHQQIHQLQATAQRQHTTAAAPQPQPPRLTNNNHGTTAVLAQQMNYNSNMNIAQPNYAHPTRAHHGQPQQPQAPPQQQQQQQRHVHPHAHNPLTHGVTHSPHSMHQQPAQQTHTAQQAAAQHSHSRQAPNATTMYGQQSNGGQNQLTLPNLSSTNNHSAANQGFVPIINNYSKYMDRYQRARKLANHQQMGLNPLTRNTSVNSSSPILQIQNANINNTTTVQPSSGNIANIYFASATNTANNAAVGYATSSAVNNSNANNNNGNGNYEIQHNGAQFATQAAGNSFAANNMLETYKQLLDAYRTIEQQNIDYKHELQRKNGELVRYEQDNSRKDQQLQALQQKYNEMQLKYAALNNELQQEHHKVSAYMEKVQELKASLAHSRNAVIVQQPASKRRKLSTTQSTKYKSINR
eukprot:CAMPEP_0197035166 /NCGR_PEP_ID=MMETSP1384-20130603/13036_1 /TAXON_ID=29189 /ORGANISM="Ammonia sp." /LENGTH=747 /DNA_ID=CAMNT_0042465191 /DNA_START=238 /DNA_END=2481 /DNA_ORIENTATION=+